MAAGSSRRFFAPCKCCGAFSGRAAVSRRQFIAGGVAAVGAVAAGSPTALFAQAKPHRIDVHHHVSPPPFVEALKKAHLDNPPINNWTPEHSLEDMDKAGTATAMLSPTTPAVGFLGPKDAADIARASNEYTKKLAEQHPGRFGMFALVPMPHPDETLKEIEYALDTLKADGIAFMTSYGGKYLGDPAFTPVWQELNRRKVTAYTHPNTPACCVNVAGFSPVYIEYGTDTTRAIASLIFTKTAARFPDINFIFSHAGGTLTALTERFSVQMMSDPKYKEFTGDEVMADLKRFYYDTAQASNPIAMASLTKLVATSQIVFGTDYPYRTSIDHVKGLAGVFGPEDLKKIERENALRLLPRLARDLTDGGHPRSLFRYFHFERGAPAASAAQ